MKACLAYIGHLIVAVIGTVVIETVLWPFFGKPSSPDGVVIKGILVSAAISLALGAANSLWRPSRAAVWIWVAPLALLLFRAVLFEASSPRSVIAGSIPDATIWMFFGLDMSRDISRTAMNNYAIFIIPTVRAAAYSVGAFAVASMSRLRSTNAVVEE